MSLNRVIALAMFLGCGVATVPASAQNLRSLSYFGNYTPYGIQSRSLVATPPYFALHPPVYYGGRHSRPYGISPFATYPQVTAPQTYKGKIQSSFVKPPQMNPYCEQGDCGTTHTTSTTRRRNGLVQSNPFVSESDVSLASSDI